MANKPSAEKRNRQAQKRRARNRTVMSTLRTAVKKARTAIDDNADDAPALRKQAISRIDRAVTKGVLRRQTAARYVSRLAAR